jgi:hypothetical protein
MTSLCAFLADVLLLRFAEVFGVRDFGQRNQTAGQARTSPVPPLKSGTQGGDVGVRTAFVDVVEGAVGRKYRIIHAGAGEGCHRCCDADGELLHDALISRLFVVLSAMLTVTPRVSSI